MVRFLCLALLGLSPQLAAHAYKLPDGVQEKAYPIQEIGVVSGFEWLDATRLIAIRNSEVAIYDMAQQHWKTVISIPGFLGSRIACLSSDRSVLQINVRVSKDALRAELRQLRVEPNEGKAVSALETPPSDQGGCGGNRIGYGWRIISSSWYGPIPEDRAIYPLGRKEDGYFDFGKWPLPHGYNYGQWVKADGTRVASKASNSDLRRGQARELFDKYLPFLDGYQLNDRCETNQYPARPPVFFFLRSAAAEIEEVPMPTDAMRQIGFCRQAIALKNGYFIDASGWPAPSNGAVFGLFHIIEGRPYLIGGTANRYLVQATRVSPDGCKVAYQVAGQGFPTRRTPDTRIVNLCMGRPSV